MSFNVADELALEVWDDMLRFTLDDLSTNWIKSDDSFIKRIEKDNLNPVFLTEHVMKEIEIKNNLDDGIRYFESDKYSKAIKKFDEVLFYDFEYGEALLNKSFSLRGQKHFVKSLRYYRRAVKCDESMRDVEYYKALLSEANGEKDNFTKLKLNIYAGDEHYSKGEYENAVASYDRALGNPSKFKDRILFKLLNKKAIALLKLDDYENALTCFGESFKLKANDYAIFGKGICKYRLNLEIDDEFKGFLNLNKRQMLTQVKILNDLGFYNQSIRINDYLWRNHFKIDGFYFNLAGVRKITLNELGMDFSEVDDVLSLF